MSFTKFINLGDFSEITKITENLAPVEANFLDENGRLHLYNTSYYFDGTKRMQFPVTKTLGTVFTVGLAFAPSSQESLGKLLGLNTGDSYIEIGKGTDPTFSIKMEGKTVKNATLNFDADPGTIKYKRFSMNPYELNILYITRDAINGISLRDSVGDRIMSFSSDTNTSGDVSFDRLGGNSIDGFEGYIAEIFLESREISVLEMRRISKVWIEKYVKFSYFDRA